ncbi:MAG TPA: class I SAM-dependent methyltransferase [Pirellulales bacterium]|nr:class I SAM-dependent methyltransferase [Pirellulales bacterium]
MRVGRVIRRAMGPFERSGTYAYRRLFVDLDAVARRMRWLAPAASVLEVGCGEGMYTEHIAFHYREATITAIDVSERAGRLFRGDRRRVEFRVETIAACVASRPRSFELAVLCDVLHHVHRDEQANFLEMVKNALAPGASVFVKEWERRTNLGYVAGWASDRLLTGDRVAFRSAAEWRALLEHVFGAGSVRTESRVGPWSNNVCLLVKT